MIGQRIGDYRVQGVLGSGGMGVVYRVQDLQTGGVAALKTVRAPAQTAMASIRREIETLRRVRHPGVVRILGQGTVENRPWYAMELLAGETLRELFLTWFAAASHHGVLTVDLHPRRARVRSFVASAPAAAPASQRLALLTIICRLCAPLAYLHGQGFVHRDLSPANIFVGADASPVLFDFGLAAHFRGARGRDILQVSGPAMGTCHYMAPEQIRAELVDARADIYALGCILYEGLTGRPPFAAEDRSAVLYSHLHESPVPPSRYADDLDADLDALVLSMLAKSPRERIGYLDAVGRRLEDLGASPWATESSPPMPYTYRPALSGRGGWLAEFDEHVARLEHGEGGVVLLAGESGVGKTRLLTEVANRAQARGLSIVTGECKSVVPGGEIRGSPLHPLRPLLQAVADRCAELGAEETAALLGRRAAVLGLYEPALAPLSSGGHETENAALPASAARYRVLAYLRETLVAFAHAQPMLLVLDDLQWADELTLAFLASLSRDFLRSAGVLLVLGYRLEEADAIAAMLQTFEVSPLVLDRVDAEAARAIVRDMLALPSAPSSLVDSFCERAEGIPFFVAEYTRAAVDVGLVRRDRDGRWQLAASDEDWKALSAPRSVHELVHRRLAALSPAAQRLLANAAVLGRECEVQTLLAMDEALAPFHGKPEQARDGETPAENAASGGAREGREAGALAALGELMARYVVAENQPGRLRFEHDMLREGAYRALTLQQRRERHRHAARAIEAAAKDRADLPLVYGALAHHWEEAGVSSEAVQALEAAADHALAGAAHAEAASFYRRVLVRGADAPAARRARWERQLGEAYFGLGDLATSERHLRAALGHLGESLPQTIHGWRARLAGGAALQLSHRLRPPLPPVQTLERERLTQAALAAARMTSRFFFADDALAMMSTNLMSVNLAERAGSRVPVAEAYAQLGYVTGLARLPRAARGYFRHARHIADATRDPIGMIKTLLSEAAWRLGAGDLPAALAGATAGLKIATKVRSPQDREDALTICAHADYAGGRLTSSRLRCSDLLESARQRHNRQHEAWGLYTVARASIPLGELDTAALLLFDARRLLADQVDHASQIICTGLLAQVHARRRDWAHARHTADQAMQLIGSRMPAVFTAAEGFIGCAEAYLELLEHQRHPSAELAALAKRACRNARRYAFTFPIARPAALHLSARLLRIQGHRRRAHLAASRAAAIASALDMPLERAHAELELALLSKGAAQAEHERHARAALARVEGAILHRLL